MSNGKVLPAVLGLVLLVVFLGAVAFWILLLRPETCIRPDTTGSARGAAPAGTPAGGRASLTAAANVKNVKPVPSSALTSVPTNAIAAVAALQTEETRKRSDELASEMSASYRKLGELRTAMQRSPAMQALREEQERDRRSLDEQLMKVPAIAALTAKRKALLDEIAALQVRQTDLSKRARADATNTTIKAEGRAVTAEIRQKGAAIGDVTRQLVTAKQTQMAGDAALSELSARLERSYAKSQAATAGDPRIQELERKIQSLAAESRQLGQRVRRGVAPPPVATTTNAAR
jgi:hypothetical protein